MRPTRRTSRRIDTRGSARHSVLGRGGITGTYFAQTDLGGLGYSGFVYDVYYVFGPDATWNPEPAPLAGAGAPVLYEGDKFLAALKTQL